MIRPSRRCTRATPSASHREVLWRYLSRAKDLALLETDTTLNAQGIAAAAHRKKRASALETVGAGPRAFVPHVVERVGHQADRDDAREVDADVFARQLVGHAVERH